MQHSAQQAQAIFNCDKAQQLSCFVFLLLFICRAYAA